MNVVKDFLIFPANASRKDERILVNYLLCTINLSFFKQYFPLNTQIDIFTSLVDQI